MKRIISKIDYDMHKLGQIDPKLALDLWYRICKNKMIISNATEIITDSNGNKCFLAPSICHMILSNPWDIDKKVYDDLVMTLLQDCSLNKLAVFGNTTFLSLILLNGALGFDDWYLKLVSKNIRNKTRDGNFEMRPIVYKEILSTGSDKPICYKNDDINISLNENEVEAFMNGCIFDVNVIYSFDEVVKLMEISKMFPTLDERVASNIAGLYQSAVNYQRYQAILKQEETTPKL